MTSLDPGNLLPTQRRRRGERPVSRLRTFSSSLNVHEIMDEVERFSRRTISISADSRRRLNSETASIRDILSSEENLSTREDDIQEESVGENREHTISNTETIIHLLKGNIGIGVLTMPIAISNAGLFGGVLGMVFVAVITIHCMHVLVRSAQKMVAVRGATFLDYADTAEASFQEAGGCWTKFAIPMRRLLNIFLCMSQLGSNAVYMLFVAQNLQPIVETYLAPNWNYRLYIAVLLGPTILICCIRNLRYLSPLSILANILEFVGLGIIFYYIFCTPLPSSYSVPWFTSVRYFPIFFGTAIFAFEGISVVLPIENQMTTPKDMLGWNGVLNTSMVTIACLYISMGFFGYLKFGEDIASSITLNLPPQDILAQLALLMFSVAVFFSYALQFYVVMDIIGPNVIKPCVSDKYYIWVEFLVRILLNVFTLALSATVPWLDLLVSLLGAVKMSTLSLMAPALIDSATNWNTDGKSLFVLRSIKNVFVFMVGFLGCVIGTYISLMDIIRNFQE